MAKKIHTVISWSTISGVPQDTVMMSFSAFLGTDWLTADFVNWETNLKTFFNTLPVTGLAAIGAYLGPQLSRGANGVTLRHYALDGHESGSAHGSPVRTISDSYTAAAATSQQPPSECSVVLSFHTQYLSDVEFAPGARPRSRDRGRVFLGPLAALALGQDATTRRPFVGTNFRSDLMLSANRLMTATGPTWAVWSRRNATLAPVVGGWVDDAFDTQRRRGEKAQVRNTFGALV